MHAQRHPQLVDLFSLARIISMVRMCFIHSDTPQNCSAANFGRSLKKSDLMRSLWNSEDMKALILRL